MGWPVRTAFEITVAESKTGQPLFYPFDMFRFPPMGGTGQSGFLGGQFEIGQRAGRYHREGLNGFDGGTGKHGLALVSPRFFDRAVWPGDNG